MPLRGSFTCCSGKHVYILLSNSIWRLAARAAASTIDGSRRHTQLQALQEGLLSKPAAAGTLCRSVVCQRRRSCRVPQVSPPYMRAEAGLSDIDLITSEGVNQAQHHLTPTLDSPCIIHLVCCDHMKLTGLLWLTGQRSSCGHRTRQQTISSLPS